jgi:acylphosphatase
MRQLHRITIRFFGKVQGVGFRRAVFDVVNHWSVTGFVKNEPDGTVLVVMESSQQQADLLIEKMKKAFLLSSVQIDVKDPLQDLPLFCIKL